MRTTGGFEFVRQVSATLLDGHTVDTRIAERLISADTGATTCTVNYVHTPPGRGSPEGMHVHSVDQLYYVLAGTMRIQIEGATSRVSTPGVSSSSREGVAHRNWNAGTEATVHLAIASPVADPGERFTRRV